MPNLVSIMIFASFCSVAHCRVTFSYSEVLQETDLDENSTALFKCANGCKIYTDSKSADMWINDGFQDVQNFLVFGGKDGTLVSTLVESNDYKLVYRGAGAPPRFVFYVVDKKSPNLDTIVITANGEPGYLSYSKSARIFTLIRTVDPASYIVFDGNFTDGFPRIYTTGFDATSEAACSPVYTARTEENALNSKIIVPSPILTVVNGPHLGMTDANYQPSGSFDDHAPFSSAVYISPGYVGCSYVKGQMYSSTTQTVHDSFSVDVSRIDLEMTPSIADSSEAVHIVVNKGKIELSGTQHIQTSFDADHFDVSIDWTRKSPSSSFLIQFDLGAKSEPSSSTKSSDHMASPTRPIDTPTTTSTSSNGILGLFSLLIVVYFTL